MSSTISQFFVLFISEWSQSWCYIHLWWCCFVPLKSRALSEHHRHRHLLLRKARFWSKLLIYAVLSRRTRWVMRCVCLVGNFSKKFCMRCLQPPSQVPRPTLRHTEVDTSLPPSEKFQFPSATTNATTCFIISQNMPILELKDLFLVFAIFVAFVIGCLVVHAFINVERMMSSPPAEQFQM